MASKSENKKSEKVEKVEEMETHSIWYGRLKSKPHEAKLFKEFITELGKTFVDEEGIKDIISHFWGKSEEELNELIKLQNKREKKVKDKFAPDNIVKAKSAYHLFTKDFVLECTKNEIKFTLTGLSTAWKALSKTEKEKYNQAAINKKKEYEIQYNVLKNKAIENGTISVDKPKRPLSSFFRYLNDNRDKIKEKLVKAGETEKLNTKITSEAGKLWESLSAKAKEPYEKAFFEENEKYSELLKEWKVNETSRLKKLDGKSEDIKVEESGENEKVEKKVEKTNKTKKTNKTDEEDEDEDEKDEEDNEVEVKVSKKPNSTEKKTKDIKSTSKATPKATPKVLEKVVKKKVNLIEAEDDEDDEE